MFERGFRLGVLSVQFTSVHRLREWQFLLARRPWLDLCVCMLGGGHSSRERDDLPGMSVTVVERGETRSPLLY